MDDQRPKSIDLPAAPKSSQPSATPTPAPSSGLMDEMQNILTGGASGTLKKATTIKPVNMNYYHEDDGK